MVGLASTRVHERAKFTCTRQPREKAAARNQGTAAAAPRHGHNIFMHAIKTTLCPRTTCTLRCQSLLLLLLDNLIKDSARAREQGGFLACCGSALPAYLALALALALCSIILVTRKCASVLSVATTPTRPATWQSDTKRQKREKKVAERLRSIAGAQLSDGPWQRMPTLVSVGDQDEWVADRRRISLVPRIWNVSVILDFIWAFHTVQNDLRKSTVRNYFLDT